MGLMGRHLIFGLVSTIVLEISHFVHIPGEVHLSGWDVRVGEAGLEVCVWLRKMRGDGAPKGCRFQGRIRLHRVLKALKAGRDLG